MSKEDMTEDLKVADNTTENEGVSEGAEASKTYENQNEGELLESLERLQGKQRRNTVCIFVLAVMLFGFAGYELTRPEVKIPPQIDYSSDISNLKSSMSALDSSVKNIAGGLSTKLDSGALGSVNAQLSGIDNSFSAIQAEIAKINAKLGEEKTVNLSWAVFDAKYLLTLANRKVVIDRDYVTAISLLKEADTVIAGINDPRTRKIRESIASDLNVLGNIPSIDHEKTLLRINELIGNVSKMRIKGLKKVDLLESSEVSGNVDDWWGNLKASFSSFVNSFVVIKRKEVTDTALIAPDNEAFLRANLENYLLLAAKACFYREQELYTQYLTKAHELVEKYFDNTDPVVVNTLKGITETASEKIATEDVKYLNSTVEISNFINEFSGK